MHAAHVEQEQKIETSPGFASNDEVVCANASVVPGGFPGSANDADAGTTLGGAVRRWGPYVLTAIVVPGGIVVALLMLARRWYRHREAANAPTLSNGRIARA